ncbi:MAG: RecX family transcriptional regulator [Bacteroidetes bacterium]|nr:RecX family transcriptional regulator [Bacteroidota bacterium]
MKKETSEKILLLKAERFCAYQERCRQEVKKKLRELGADEKTSAKIISSLEEDDFLKEERFAKLFTQGKFRIKRWGKIKIKAELRKKNIAGGLIENALEEINEEEYLKTIQHLVNKKSREVKIQNSKEKIRKVLMFLLSRGFESEMIWKILNSKSA